MSNAKILFLDIETFPNLGWTWGKWDQTVLKFERETLIACYAAKWQHGKVFTAGLNDFSIRPSLSDKPLVVKLRDLLDKAEIVVTHNGNKFDLKVIRGAFVRNGISPPSPFKSVDTRALARRLFRFNSNSLDDLSALLNSERKIKTDFELWEACMKWEPKAWAKMRRYNARDVLLLEKLYKRFLPFIPSHPNVSIFAGVDGCPNCGSTRLHSRGVYVALSRQYQSFQCQSCGAWSRVARADHDRDSKYRTVAMQ